MLMGIEISLTKDVACDMIYVYAPICVDESTVPLLMKK